MVGGENIMAIGWIIALLVIALAGKMIWDATKAVNPETSEEVLNSFSDALLSTVRRPILKDADSSADTDVTDFINYTLVNVLRAANLGFGTPGRSMTTVKMLRESRPGYVSGQPINDWLQYETSLTPLENMVKNAGQILIKSMIGGVVQMQLLSEGDTGLG